MIARFEYFLILTFVTALNFMAPMFCSKVFAAPFSLHIAKNLKKSKLVGEWQVITEVVWSDCPYVDEGKKAVSKLVVRDFNGRVYPQWQANDWVLLENSQINISENKTIRWERKDALMKDDELWQTESVDRFELTGNNAMSGESLVRQYLNGEYVGTYMTISYLTKN